MGCVIVVMAVMRQTEFESSQGSTSQVWHGQANVLHKLYTKGENIPFVQSTGCVVLHLGQVGILKTLLH